MQKSLLIGLGFAILANVGDLGCTKCPKAKFVHCSRKLSPRDVVFIMDQSGTMYGNDKAAIRWEGVEELVHLVFSEERAYAPDRQLTRFAIIPFGSEEETRRFADTEIKNGITSSFPLARPGLVEIEVTTRKETTLPAIMQSLRLFLQTSTGTYYFDNLIPLSSQQDMSFDQLFRFKIDTTALTQKDSRLAEPASIQSWGVESKIASAVTLASVDLIIKDNWAFRVEKCVITRMPTSVSWLQRLLKRLPRPVYKLQLEAAASHPCSGLLPCGHLNVTVHNRTFGPIRPTKVDTLFHYSSTTREKAGHTYHWEFNIEDLKEFNDNVGELISIIVKIDDLYAGQIRVPTEVPPNGRIISRESYVTLNQIDNQRD